MRWTFLHDWRRILYTHPLILIAGFFLAGLLLLLLVGLQAEDKERRSFVAYSERLMQTFIERERHELEKLARDYAIWDLFAQQMQGDQVSADWLKANLTESIYRNFEVADALVLSAHLQPVYYLRRGTPIPLDKLTDWHPEFAEALRRSLVKQPGLSALSGYLRREGGPVQLVVAERIRPEHPQRHERGGGWLVFARNIDGKWLEASSHLLAIKGLTLSSSAPADGMARLELPGLAQSAPFWLGWRIEPRRVSTLVSASTLLGLAALGVFVLLLARAVLQMHRHQQRIQQRMLEQSETLRALSRLPHGSSADEFYYLNEIAQAVARALEVSRVSVWRAENGLAVSCLAQVGELPSPEQGALILSPAYVNALQEKRSLLLDNPADASDYPHLGEYWQQQGLKAELGVAILVRGRLAGVLRVEALPGNPTWAPDQHSFVQGAAELVAQALISAERRRAEMVLHRQQYYDALTGLPNQDRLNHLLQRHLMVPGSRLVYSLWCIEALTSVNEAHGRPGGDTLLQTMAARLDAITVPHLTARLAGSRFVLVLLDVPPPLVSQEIEKTLYRLQEPVELEGQQLMPQVSCGVSIAPQDAFTVDELLRHAEFVLELARSRDENPIEFYAPEPNTVARERYRLAGAMPAALIRGEFELFFQPQVMLENREIVGVEALLRWHHPEKGEMPPQQFIQIAEETGQIHLLGRFVIEDACRRLRGWLDHYGRALTLAINVSPLQLRAADFLAFLEKTLAEHGIEPAQLVLEFGESEIQGLVAEAGEALACLRERGVRLALGDFGTGEVPLGGLLGLPISQLKLDRSRVENLPQSRHTADFARMTTSLGKIAGMEVVAVGVESEAQARFLREQGCRLAQGFLFSKPVNAAGLGQLLEHGLSVPAA